MGEIHTISPETWIIGPQRAQLRRWKNSSPHTFNQARKNSGTQTHDQQRAGIPRPCDGRFVHTFYVRGGIELPV